VIHISTDYVFEGKRETPYCEDYLPDPRTMYGRSKLAGETAVAASNPDHAILRTAWVYSPFGRNFVRTMLALGETREELGVVADQIGCPPSALDIADAVFAVARNLRERPRDASLRGVFHMAGQGETSWAGFAEAIFAEAQALGRKPVRVRPIGTADYPTPARRPANSRLDCAKLAAVHGIRLPDWREATKVCVGRLLAEAAEKAS
jgi:dTDP-4-dehydrorhamnose reductase